MVKLEDAFGLDTPIWEKPIAYKKGTRVQLRYFAGQALPFEVMVMNRAHADNYGFAVERPVVGRWVTLAVDLDRTKPHEAGGPAWKDGDPIDAIRLRGLDTNAKYDLWIDDLTLLVPAGR